MEWRWFECLKTVFFLYKTYISCIYILIIYPILSGTSLGLLLKMASLLVELRGRTIISWYCMRLRVRVRGKHNKVWFVFEIQNDSFFIYKKIKKWKYSYIDITTIDCQSKNVFMPFCHKKEWVWSVNIMYRHFWEYGLCNFFCKHLQAWLSESKWY